MTLHEITAAVRAIQNFVYFCFNHPNPEIFITECWGEGIVASHIREKLLGHKNNICKFFTELDVKNQEKFASWIVEHYDDAPKKVKTRVQRWHEAKASYDEAILLFRCGDFYETYNEDAILCSEKLGITLNGKASGFSSVAGFPYHALDVYLPKLIRFGYKICIMD